MIKQCCSSYLFEQADSQGQRNCSFRHIRCRQDLDEGRRYSIIKQVMERQKKTNLAIKELGLIVSPDDQSDKYQLGDLLCEILPYPTIEEAKQHRKANRLGNFDLLAQQKRLLNLLNDKNTNQLKLCPCCGNIINQSKIPFLCPLSQIRLGIGVRLYFTTLLYFIITFMVAFFLYSLYNMITNINASKQQLQQLSNICAQNGDCSTANLGLGSKFTGHQYFKNQLAVQSVLGFMYVLVWGFLIIRKYSEDRKLELELKGDWLSSSEFTLMLTGYPKNLINPRSSEQTLKNVKKIFKDYELEMKSRISFQVKKISIGYPLYQWNQEKAQNIMKAEQQIEQKRTLFKNLIFQRQKSAEFDMPEDKRNEEYQLYYQMITNQQYEKNNQFPDLDDKNIIFVTLRYSKARQIIEYNQKNKKSWWGKCQGPTSNSSFPIDGVKVERAPEPDQIKWENIGFPKRTKLCRKILIYSLAMILICITLAVSILLGSFQSENKAIFVSISISIVITIFNFLIEMLIIFLSYFEKQFQKSKDEASIGIKIAVSQIINTIGVPITLAFLGKVPIFQQGGLVTQVLFIGLFNMVLPIGRFIDPFNMVLKLRQKYYANPQRRLKNLSGQTELNKIFTFYEFQLGYQYAYIIKTSYFTAFFLPLQPIIALFAPIGLGLMFGCNKYRLLYRFNKPNFHSSSVNSMLTFILKCSLIAFTLGQLYFMNFQNYSANFNLIINWVALGISALFVFFPLRYCRKFFKEETPVSMDYNEQELYLTTDYDRLNPITKENAIHEFKQFLQQYEKKCHLPLPQKSMMIVKSLNSQIKMNAPASILFRMENTKFQHHLGSGLLTNDRLR